MGENKKTEVKLKLLDYATKDMDNVLATKLERTLKEKHNIIEKTLADIEALKYKVIEDMLTNDSNPEEVDLWATQLQTKMDPFHTMVTGIKDALKEIMKADMIDMGKQMATVTNKEAKITTNREETKVQIHAKLPKLKIATFDGTHIDWFRFWNQFEAEIDGSTIAPVTKFSYLRDMLSNQPLSMINGLPFNAEGYERAKTILQSKYGKSSEVVNAHIQSIMSLPLIQGTSTSKIHDFYEVLVNSIQSLETMGKLNQIEGYVRMTLDKLPGIRSDLVRLDKDWHSWNFATFVSSLSEWIERNPRTSRDQGRDDSWRDHRNDSRRDHRNNSQRDRRDNSRRDQRNGSRRDQRNGDRRDRDESQHPGEPSLSTKSETQKKCAYCGEDHTENNCTKVTDKVERRKILQNKRRCFNCTKSGHQASACKARTCFNCKGKHHTSICDKRKEPGLTGSTAGDTVIYPIVQVKVNKVKCWALLDSGAGSNYISSTLAKKLDAPIRKQTKKIEMLMTSSNSTVEVYEIEIESLNSTFKVTSEANKVQKDTLLHLDNPHYSHLKETYDHLRRITFNPDDLREEIPVHLIIGVDVYCQIKMKKEPKLGQPRQPIAEMTKLGWVVMSPGEEVDKRSYLTHSSATDYDQLCRLDVLGIQDSPDGDQQTVHSEFREQLKRDEEGWYETGLMWKANHTELPNNKAASLRRTNNTITKLKRNQDHFEEYHQKITDQIKEGILEPANEEANGREYYIPHKPVRNDDRETTKLRIVYDASAKPNDRSPSLNDCLETGPTLMNKIWSIIVRNRMRPVTIMGDIKQAFHQIRIREEDRDALRFHWITDTDSCTRTILRFTRAVMGVNQSTFLLSGVLDYHLNTYNEDPRQDIIDALKDEIYVDDVIGGANTTIDAQKFKSVATDVLGDAAFHLHKWHSNVLELEDNQKDSDFSAILGVSWNKRLDTFAVKFPQTETDETKRGVLRYLASIYDPIGIASPVTLTGKMMIYRSICDNKLGWDQPLSVDLQHKWRRWLNHIPEEITIPRSIALLDEEIQEITLHAFGDASKEGTSAAVYTVIKQGDVLSQGLLCSSSRLAKRNLTIPRLELVSAHMATNLLHNVRQALSKFPVVREVAWLDSTAALHWIKGDGQYKEFVRNRVKKIREKQLIWRYVDTKQNPTDIGSRGCQGDKLTSSWLEGPSWLKDEQLWPRDITTVATEETEAESKIIKEVLATAVKSNDRLWTLIDKFSFWKTLRITAWIKRFLKNFRLKKRQRDKGPLTTEEIKSSKETWIKQVQSNHHQTEKFMKDRETLNLQKNASDMYVCMGRIDGDYPIYLPTNDVFTEKLIQHSHKKTLHGGVGFTMADVRKDYWIPRLRQLTKSAIHRCHGCKRFPAIAFSRPKPGSLPADRTVGDRPFQIVGLDFAGPFTYLSKSKEEKKESLHSSLHVQPDESSLPRRFEGPNLRRHSGKL